MSNSSEATEFDQLKRGTLILWGTSQTYDGNLGGREGADKICRSNLPPSLICSNTHAFISIETNDTIKNMPKIYGYENNKAIYWYNKSTRKFLLATNE